MRCILCDHLTSSFLHPKMNIVFHECPFCQLIFKDIKHEISKEETFQIYQYHQNSIENQGYVAYLKHFIDVGIIPYQHARGLRALDFGSGPGPVLAYLLNNTYGYQTDIYDIYYQPDKVYLDQTYDLITCTEVIEHIRNPHEVFKLFHRILNKQGILAMMTLFHPQDQKMFLNWFYIRDKSHICFYTPKTIEMLAHIHGFQLIWHDNKRIMTFKHLSSIG